MVTEPVIMVVSRVQKSLDFSEGNEHPYCVVCFPEDSAGRPMTQHKVFVYVGVGEGSLLYAAHSKLDKGSRIKMLVQMDVQSAIMMLDETWTYAGGRVLGFWNVQR